MLNHKDTLLALAATKEGIHKINTLAAELMGWTYTPRKLSLNGVYFADPTPWVDPTGKRQYEKDIPNYCEDLNLSAQLESFILRGAGSWFIWTQQLSKVTNESMPIRASALHRTIACLLAAKA